MGRGIGVQRRNWQPARRGPAHRGGRVWRSWKPGERRPQPFAGVRLSVKSALLDDEESADVRSRPLGLLARCWRALALRLGRICDPLGQTIQVW